VGTSASVGPGVESGSGVELGRLVGRVVGDDADTVGVWLVGAVVVRVGVAVDGADVGDDGADVDAVEGAADGIAVHPTVGASVAGDRLGCAVLGRRVGLGVGGVGARDGASVSGRRVGLGVGRSGARLGLPVTRRGVGCAVGGFAVGPVLASVGDGVSPRRADEGAALPAGDVVGLTEAPSARHAPSDHAQCAGCSSHSARVENAVHAACGVGAAGDGVGPSVGARVGRFSHVLAAPTHSQSWRGPHASRVSRKHDSSVGEDVGEPGDLVGRGVPRRSHVLARAAHSVS